MEKIDRSEDFPMSPLKVFMLLVFALFAGLQYNDSDSLLWIVLYGYAWGVTLLALLRPGRLLPGLGILLFAVMLLVAPAESDPQRANEVLYEVSGLLICLAWMIVLVRGARRRASIE